MKTTVFSLLIFSFFCTSSAHAQIISQFTWDDPSLGIEIADIGPNGTTFSSSAISDVGGVGGTNGLNASLPKLDINMSIPGSPTFDIDGIDVSFDYQREESQCDWFRRGNSLIMDGSNQFSVSYRVMDGMGGFVTVNTGNVFNIPNDDVFRNYRFIYLPDTGEGIVMVDGTIVWTNDGPDNRPLYWTGAGNVTVGSGCDGSGTDDTFMDNLIVAAVTFSPLPIELVSFRVSKKNKNHSLITWSSASESNNDFYTIERSSDGQNWSEIGTVDGVGNSSQTIHYDFVDKNPLVGVNYYRLKQTDFDGGTETFNPKKLFFGSSQGLNAYPNPTNDMVTVTVPEGVDIDEVQLFNSLGQDVSQYANKTILGNESIQFNLELLPVGIYMVRAGLETIKVVRDN